MRIYLLLFAFFSLLKNGISQINIDKPFEDLVFTKNEGQWINEEKETHSVIYFGAYIQGKQVFITDKGLAYKYLNYYNEKKGFFEKYFEKKRKHKEQKEEEDEEEEFYKNGKYISHYVYLKFENSSNSSKIIAENKTTSYTSYSNPLQLKETIKAFGYQKIIVKNIYNKIDVVYEIKPTGGFEYSFVLNPFADANLIKINYVGFENLELTNENKLNCKIDEANQLVESEPIVFYKKTNGTILCNRNITNNIQQFTLGNYNSSEEVIIDPIVFNPLLTAYNRAYDIAKDNAGNIIIYGGQCPYVLKKFSSAGVLLWSFDWSTQPSPPTLYGDFAVDQNDNIIMVQGYPAGRIIKTDPTGAILFNIILAGSAGANELWRVGFNCNYSALRISGYVQSSGYKQMVNMNPLTGAVIGVSTSAIDESRALFIDPSGEIYSLTPSQGLSSNPLTNYFTKFDVALSSVYRIVSGYNTNEGSGIYHSVTYDPTRFYSNMNAITADNNNVYTYEGRTLFKRRQSTGLAVASIVIPGGAILANSGIIIDPCFNLFVGTQSSIVRLDTSLNIISSQPTPAQVYDICLYNGKILATGNGFVKEFDFGTNCFLTVTTATTANTRCSAPFNGTAAVTSVTNGIAPFTYLWNTGVTTSTISGLAPGKYWVLTKDSYCGNPKTSVDTVYIPNNLTLPTASFSVNNSCLGSATVYNDLSSPIAPSSFSVTSWAWDFTSNGTNDNFSQNPTFYTTAVGIYTTSLFVTAANSCTAIVSNTFQIFPNPIISLVQSASPRCVGLQSYTFSVSGASSYTWSSATTLSSASGSVVVANPLTTTVYTVTGNIGSCISSLLIPATVAPNLIAATSQTNVTCNTFSNGIASVSVTSGSGPYAYLWTTSPTQTTQTATNLAPGIYSVTVSSTSCSTSSVELITNGDFSSGNSGFSSSYTYTPPPNTLEGQYWVGTGANTTVWNPGLSSAGDHTSGSGNYLLINGAAIAGVSVYCQTIPVIPSTNYSFSTWLSNLTIGATPSQLAQLQFYINGIPLGSIFTAPLAVNVWAQFAATWNSGVSTSANICIVNQSTSIAGNDFGLDDISFNECVLPCPVTKTITITEPLPLIVAVNTSTICAGLQTATLSATGASTYSWTSGLSSATGSIVTGTPSSSQNYTVTGTDINGCVNTKTTSITVNALPTVTVNSATICLGQQTATLIATGATTYSWTSGLSAASGSIVTGTPTSSQNYTVIGADANGCVDTKTMSITVNTLPILSVNSSTICLGQQIATLTVSGANTYLWSAGLNSTTGAIVTGTPSLSQSYTVVGTDINGCVNTKTTSITVNFLPTIAVNTSTICAGLQTATLSATGASTYSWTSGLSSATGSIVTGTPSSSQNYTVTGTDINGCVNTKTTSITVNALPTVTVNSATICLGQQTATLIATGATTYSWTSGLSAASGSIVTGTPTSSQNYTVTGADANGCVGVNTSTITVVAIPTLAATSGTICSATNTLLMVSGSNTYTWSPFASLSSSMGSSVTASPVITTAYTITSTSLLGCISFTTVTVSVVSTPTILATASPTAMCISSVSTLNASGATSYTWSPGLVTASSTTVSPASTTIYTVAGSNTNGVLVCSSSQSVMVTIIPQTTVNAFGTGSLCLGGTKNIFASGASSYTWTPSIGISNPYSSSIVVKPSVTTIYTVTASQGGLCPQTATLQIIVHPLPYVYAGVDTTINMDESYVLHGIGNVPVGFLSPNSYPLICNYCSAVEVNPKETTCYTLKGETEFGCVAYDEVCINVTKDWNVYIPNAFSPNGDVDNDIFIPVGYGISEIKLYIFDRWGEIIFTSNSKITGWDGTFRGSLCKEGVYVYKAEIKTMSGIELFKTGHVTLLSNLK